VDEVLTWLNGLSAVGLALFADCVRWALSRFTGRSSTSYIRRAILWCLTASDCQYRILRVEAQLAEIQAISDSRDATIQLLLAELERDSIALSLATHQRHRPARSRRSLPKTPRSPKRSGSSTVSDGRRGGHR
jgi:hypothetical protein